MIYKSFKDIQLSTLGLGNMRLPLEDPSDPNSKIDREKAFQIIDYALENGVNYFDTAYVYNNGDSEATLGAALKRHNRDDFYIATKYNVRANVDYKEVFQTQLERLQTDHIDFYLIHCLMDNNIDDYLNNGCIQYFNSLKQEGKIKYLGFSSHASVETLKRFVEANNWDFAQLQINYFDYCYSKTKEEYQILKDNNIPIMVMEPVRGGRLSKLNSEAEDLLKQAHPEYSISSWALRFVRTLDQVQVILSGMSDLEQVEDNIKTFSDPYTLNQDDIDTLMKAANSFHSSLLVPCTACRYCCEDCPMQINIPEYLKVYNTYKTVGKSTAKEQLKSVQSTGTPNDCIGCGSCSSHCPQNINIPEIMEELKELL